MTGFSVDVYYTDRTRTPDGQFVQYRSRVDVLATGPQDAICAAVQQVVAIRCDLGVMPLAASIVI